MIARYGALDGVVPDGARAIPLGDPIGETAYALPRFRALVPGDVVLGGDAIEGERRDGPARLPARLVRPHRRRARVVRRHRAARARCGGSRRSRPSASSTTHGTPLLSGGGAALRALAASASARRSA